MNSANWKNVLEPILKEVFINTYLEIPSVVPQLYGVESSKKAKETYLTIANGGEVAQFNGKIVYDQLDEGYKTEIENIEFAKGFDIQKKLFDDDQYGIMKGVASNLATLTKYSREKYGIDIFNNAFSAGSLGADGENLVDTAHTSTVGGVSTQSNYCNLALSYDNFVAARQQMKKFKDLNGKSVHMVPNILFAPVELEITAKEIANSIYKPSSAAYMTANVVKDEGLKIIVSEFLSNPKAWFVIDGNLSKKVLKWQNRIPVQMLKDETFDQLVLKVATYYRIGRGYTDWRFLVGSAGG